MNEEKPSHQRRPRYRGTHPRRFAEKYKELDPERYAEDVLKVIDRGHTPAGMHRPVMVNEVLEVLHPQPGETGLDATLGFGGHARELLARIMPGGRLFATDVDPLELPRTEARLRNAGFDEHQLIIRKSNYAGIARLLPELEEGCDFVLADLGISSMQLDNPERGFTFKSAGPLDLRLNPEHGQSAAALLKTLSTTALVKILRTNADEPHAEAIAAAIAGCNGTIATTLELADAVRAALAALPIPNRDRETTKALQRTFQALRIAVNDEFSALEQFLRVLPLVMKSGGRVAILTFHSGEDRRVKQAFEDGMLGGSYAAISQEALRPTGDECYANPRSKCARLRWAVRA